jgi:ParB family transcriptional regulator, chromosome partitioning protein
MTMTATSGTRAGHDKEKVEKRRALGRGLESLLPGPRMVPPAPAGPAAKPQVSAPIAGSPGSGAGSVDKNGPSAHPQPDEAVRNAGPVGLEREAAPASGNLVVNVALVDIDRNPFQTRHIHNDEALEELSESIRTNGVVQPIVVRPSEEDEGRYVLILGERRLHASKKAGKTHIPALIRKVALQQAAEMTIVENLQREDLSPLEQAEAFRVLSMEFKLTQQQIAERVGLSRVSVANYMRLLKLPPEVIQLVADKRINFAQAKELLKLNDNQRIVEAALYAVKKGMTVEQIETLVLRMEGLLEPTPDMPGPRNQNGGARWVNPDPNVRAAQMELERMLGVRVRIRDRKGKGKIVIEYSTVDDYERLVELLRGKN